MWTEKDRIGKKKKKNRPKMVSKCIRLKFSLSILFLCPTMQTDIIIVLLTSINIKKIRTSVIKWYQHGNKKEKLIGQVSEGKKKDNHTYEHHGNEYMQYSKISFLSTMIYCPKLSSHLIILDNSKERFKRQAFKDIFLMLLFT